MTQPLDRRYDIAAESSIDVSALETFPYEYPGRDIVVTIDTDEFTAVCPFSGLPDFATIRIDYTPAKAIIELRSLKYYLFSYMEYLGKDYAADMAKMAADPTTQQWWAECIPCQKPLANRGKGEWWTGMDEAFHLD